MGAFVNKEDLKCEEEIIWSEEITEISWVRESSADFRTRKGISPVDQSRFEAYKTEKNADQIVGYADLADDTPPSFYDDDGTPYFLRRIFTLRPSDRSEDSSYKKTGRCPIEAVDPMTVQPKIQGLSPNEASKLKKYQIAVRVPPSLYQKLEDYIARTGISKTEAVVSALARYLDEAQSIPLIQRVIELERRVTALESRF